MVENELIWLTYLFQGFKFEFVKDVVVITDLHYKKKYQLIFNGQDSFPFQIEMIEMF